MDIEKPLPARRYFKTLPCRYELVEVGAEQPYRYRGGNAEEHDQRAVAIHESCVLRDRRFHRFTSQQARSDDKWPQRPDRLKRDSVANSSLSPGGGGQCQSIR